MAVYNKAKLVFASTDISSQIRTVAFNHSAEELDDTAMGDDTRTSAGGLENWTIEGEANQNYGTGSVDAAFATRVGETASIVFRHTSTATALASSNPKYSGSGLLTEYVPAQGSVGDQHVSTFSIVSAGDITREVST